jgi:RNA polymerase sigma factor (sigma-70 family)
MTEQSKTASIEQSANNAVEHLFRQEYGKLVAHLTRVYGTRHLELIEDAVQEALASAMQTWPFSGTPNNPTGWIFRVAKNQLIDTLRRAQKVTTEVPEDFIASHEHNNDNSFMKDVVLESELRDDQLRMIFACCHPTLSPESQMVLTLKLVAGFGKKEIAKALLKKEDAVAKAYTRAKSKLKEEVQELEVPIGQDLLPRLEVAVRIIYLIFNEGYSSSIGETVIRRDLCEEAIRLTSMLLEHEACNYPLVHAQMALMYFHVARFEARSSEDGELISLEDQDRSLWDKEVIGIGLQHMAVASQSEVYSEYHLQASMAYYHCIAERFEDTNWASILSLYNIQMAHYPSPIAGLNRVVAVSKVHGAAVAFKDITALETDARLQQNHLLYAVKSELHQQLGEVKAAQECLERAISICSNAQEQQFLQKKLQRLA